ncbi:MAG: hypothetical protein JNJ45_08380 [Chthonomonas sp.]|nr:hypothetical protein [Chthonomonas sp.]
MEILLTGTGASEGIPSLYADSRVSQYAHQHGGKDRRSRASALVDGFLKIDMGPDTLGQVGALGLNPREWGAVLYTHSHDDHFAASELQYSLYPFTSLHECPYSIYGNQVVLDAIHLKYPEWPFDLHLTESFRAFQVAEYTVTPIHAMHKLDEDAQNLIISDGHSTLLYATDTGLWDETTWEFLRDFRLDALVIECTEGLNKTSYYGHLALSECVDQVQRLRKAGILRADGPVATTHISHFGDLTHAELANQLAPHNILAGYDGMSFTF